MLIVKHEGKPVGAVATNQSLSTDRVLELIGIDPNEKAGNDFVWDYNAFEIEDLTTEEYTEQYPNGIPA